jgi:hypothetical protein
VIVSSCSTIIVQRNFFNEIIEEKNIIFSNKLKANWRFTQTVFGKWHLQSIKSDYARRSPVSAFIVKERS